MQTTPTFDVPSVARLQQRGLVLAVIGLAAGLVGAAMNLDQFFRSWLLGVLFILSFALGSLSLLMMQHLSGGQWGLVGRRIFEAGCRTLFLVAILFLPLFFGLPRLFEWAQPEAVEHSRVLQAKAPYLNWWFFIVRAVIYFVFWGGCVWLLNKWSGEQDRGEAVTKRDSIRFRMVSGPGLVFLVLTVTLASIDWIMSLEPEWFSTIFGLLTITGYGLTAFAFTIVVLALVYRDNPEGSFISKRHFHDYGKLLLTFIMLWAYLSFSQFLIIWAGNLPEEIPWYVERIRGSWGAVAILLIVGHFALPFTMLLSANLKKRSTTIARVAIFVLVMRFVDLLWYVTPAFRLTAPAEAALNARIIPFHWMDIAIPAGLFGLWLFMFARELRARPQFPVNDPYFQEAFAHEAAH